jgi:O-antigen ligase
VSKLTEQKSFLILILIAIFSALFFGLISLALVNIVGNHYLYLLALPLAIVVGLIFIFSRIFFLSLVIVARSSLDVAFEAIKIGNFGLGAVLNALVILIAVLMYFDTKNQIKSEFSLPLKAWFIFLLLNTLSLVYTPVFSTGLKANLSYLSYASIFLIGLYLVKTEDDFKKWIKIIVLSSAIPAIYGLLSLIFGLGGLRFSIGEGWRLQSTFPHPNPFAPYMVLMTTLAFYLYKDKTSAINNTVRRMLPIYILMLAGLLLMTKTRSAWASCYLLFLVYGFFWERKLLFVVLTVPFLALLIPEIQDRILDATKNTDYGATGYGRLNSYAWRLKIWHDSFEWMSPTRYLTGYGVHSFVHHSMDFGWANAFQRTNFEINAHNIFVQTFFNLGLFGLISFLYLFYSIFKTLIRLYNYNKFLIFIALMALLQLLMQGYSDNIWDYLIFEWYFWFFAGLTISYVSLQKKQKSDTSKVSAHVQRR